MGRRVGGSWALLYHRTDRAARPPRLGDTVHGVRRPRHGRAGLPLRRLYRRLVGVLHPVHRPDVLWQRELLGRRALYGRDLAGAIARQRYGRQLRHRQFGQVHRTLRPVPDHGRRRRDQAGCANLAMLGPAFVYFASWYVLGLIGFWVFGYEPKGRSFDEIDAALDRPAEAARGVAQVAGN